MYELFYKYFILNKKIGLPGIGNFYAEYVPAKMDIVNHTLTAPKHAVNFTTNQPTNDSLFFEYLLKEMKLKNSIEAVAHYIEFSNHIQEKAGKNGAFLPGMGTLKKNEIGAFTFYPEVQNNLIQPLIQLNHSIAANANIIDVYGSEENKIILQDAIAPEEEKIIMSENDDYWWVYAIILALMGLGALLYYYI